MSVSIEKVADQLNRQMRFGPWRVDTASLSAQWTRPWLYKVSIYPTSVAVGHFTVGFYVRPVERWVVSFHRSGGAWSELVDRLEARVVRVDYIRLGKLELAAQHGFGVFMKGWMDVG